MFFSPSATAICHSNGAACRTKCPLVPLIRLDKKWMHYPMDDCYVVYRGPLKRRTSEDGALMRRARRVLFFWHLSFDADSSFARLFLSITFMYVPSINRGARGQDRMMPMGVLALRSLLRAGIATTTQMVMDDGDPGDDKRQHCDAAATPSISVDPILSVCLL